MAWHVNTKSVINGIYFLDGLQMRGINNDSAYYYEFSEFTQKLSEKIRLLRKKQQVNSRRHDAI